MATIRVLVVDDYEPFRRVVRLILELRDDLQIVGEASDGLEAAQKAKGLQPDLILLDISLPKLNGIRVAKRLRDLVPHAKILFVSVESSSDVVREALNMGGSGYVHKLRVGSELMPAIDAVIRGQRFVSSGLADELGGSTGVPPSVRHEVLFYSSDSFLLEGLTRFIAAALKAGSAAIAIATQSHRWTLLEELKAQSVDVDVMVRRGSYISMDAAEMLSKFMDKGMPNAEHFDRAIGQVITQARQAATDKQARVAAFGEMVALLWNEGNTQAVVCLEELWNVTAKAYDVDVLCAYPLQGFHGDKDQSALKAICARHSAVHTQ